MVKPSGIADEPRGTNEARPRVKVPYCLRTVPLAATNNARPSWGLYATTELYANGAKSTLRQPLNSCMFLSRCSEERGILDHNEGFCCVDNRKYIISKESEWFSTQHSVHDVFSVLDGYF